MTRSQWGNASVQRSRAAARSAEPGSGVTEPPQPAPREEAFTLDDRELIEMGGASPPLRMEAGTALLNEDEPIEFLYLIRSGEVEVYRRTNKRRAVVQILRGGDLVGLTAHIRGTPAPFSARAITPVTAIRLRPEAVTWLLQTRPSLSRRIMGYLASGVERLERRVAELSGADLRGRMAGLLLDETAGGPGTIRLPQSTLADLLGATRSSVNRILKEFESEGLVRVRYRRVEVLDAPGIRRLNR